MPEVTISNTSVSEVDGKHVITINGTAHDNSEIEYLIFKYRLTTGINRGH